MDKKFPFVDKNIENSVGHIEFYHPAHNSLPGELLKKLKAAIEEFSNNNEIKVITIESHGDRTFCAGASFTELVAIGDKESGKEFFLGFANVINAIRKSSKIVIICVQGKTVGGGVGLASAADYCIATKWASVRLSELAVGIGPFVIGPAVERKIGNSHFTKMSLTPDEWQTAEWAKMAGLFHDVFPTKEQMKDYKNHLVEKLCGYNPLALAELKKVFWTGTDDWDELLADRAEISGELVLSDHAKNAISGFLQA